MYQHELFRNQAKAFTFLGRGVNARVYDLEQAPGWVLKVAARRDATLNLLEWALMMKRRGTPVAGAPDVDFITYTDDGYICAMRKYHEQDDKGEWLCHMSWSQRNEAIEDVIDSFNYYMCETFGQGDCGGSYCHDIHEHNFMWCPVTKRCILTDPSNDEYITANVRSVTLQ